MDFLDNIILLGMAFYVLRATHLLFECYSGRQKPVKWSELIAWLWFLPTLQVGPINRFGPFQQDLLRRRWDNQLFVDGIERLVFGFFKNYCSRQLPYDGEIQSVAHAVSTR